MLDVFLLMACLCFSALSTSGLIHYSTQRQLLDAPNERSSHSVPMPTGGGVAILVTFLFFLAWLSFTVPSMQNKTVVLMVTAALLGVVGYIDDYWRIAVRWRLLVHFCAALLLIYVLSALPVLRFFDWQWQSGWLLTGLYVVGLVWLLNLFNFMDGIDGIAGVEAVSCLLGAAFILSHGGESEWTQVLFALALCVLGFLCFNWPPAKIFMGDVGSGFLGFMLGALALITAATDLISLWSWIILLAVFIADATLTLMRRALKGQRVYEAHRSHAYQILSRRWRSHRRVTWLVLAINVCWLLPLAWAGSEWPGYAWLIAIMAYVPITVFFYRVGAGTTNT